jgi:hypothetical protein
MCLFALALAACAGPSSGRSTSGTGQQGQLTVSPASVDFGNVAVGSTLSKTGTLGATGANVTISSAAWNGQGYSVGGITFPVTVAASKFLNYTVTFTPQALGSTSGQISFVSNASNSLSPQVLTGTGTQASAHTVDLSWNASSSTVAGYNVYRGTQLGGPYAKLNSSLVAGTTYTDAIVLSGKTYYYVSTAVDSSNLESSYSNQATAAIP